MTREVETRSTVDGVPNPNPNPTSEVCSAFVPKHKHKQKAKKPQAVRCSEFEERTGLAGGGGSSRGPRAVTEAWGITEV